MSRSLTVSVALLGKMREGPRSTGFRLSFPSDTLLMTWACLPLTPFFDSLPRWPAGLRSPPDSDLQGERIAGLVPNGYSWVVAQWATWVSWGDVVGRRRAGAVMRRPVYSTTQRSLLTHI